MSNGKKRAAILGATGYTGVEAVRLLLSHPNINIAALSGHSKAGQSLADSFPNMKMYDLPQVQRVDEIDFSDIDVVFSCLPHGASQDVLADILDTVETVIDLSADFRLKDPELYAQTYGRSHDHASWLERAVYGLTEFAYDELKGAKLVACPGCYPTASLLALLPGSEAGYFGTDPIIIDAKSGVTGAGRKVSEGLIYTELTDGAHAYGVGVHRHAPEIDQALSKSMNTPVCVSFTPHLLPMNRGMIATCYVTLNNGYDVARLRELYQKRYASSPFVHVMDEGGVPQTRHIRGSNHAMLGVFSDRQVGRAIIISVIDNLVKGSSGQAIQNYNIVSGWDESLGLTQAPIFP